MRRPMWRQRNRPEWPPHPDRLFQALVDAAQPEDRAALRWLEQQPAPGIVCGETVPLESAETFVPVNHPGASPDPDRRGKQPRTFPISFPRGPVGFVWPEPDDACREALARIAARVANVGRAESLVLLRVEAGDAEPALVPDERGEQGLRVPHAGRLDVLDQAFGIGRYPPAAPMVRYAEAGRVVALPPWSELIAVRLAHPLSVERVAQAAEALRRAVLSRVGDDAPAVLHGHGPHTHVAWVGLPNLSPYAPGELLGLAMALPRNIDPMERAQCVRGLLAVDHIMLGERRVGVERPTQAMSLAARTWSHASTRMGERDAGSVRPLPAPQSQRRAGSDGVLRARRIPEAAAGGSRSGVGARHATGNGIPVAPAGETLCPCGGRIWSSGSRSVDRRRRAPLWPGVVPACANLK